MKILCKFHDDTTPSMEIYGKYGFCFVCLAHVQVSELDLPGNIKEIREKKNPTNIPSMLEYIKSLPLKEIRGFKFHANETGYYIIWPLENFYKKRNFDESKGRYVSPSGVKKPLFVYAGDAQHLLVVEGEINAMSLHNSLYGEYKVCSPGPASDLLRYVKYYLQFERITIFVDYDATGVVFGSYLKEVLLRNHKHAQLIAVERDFNDVHQEGGEKAVREEFEKHMGMSG